MNEKVAEEKAKLVKYQVYLDEELQEGLQAYIRDNYTPNTNVITAIFRKAIAEFLKKEGYYGTEDQQTNS